MTTQEPPPNDPSPNRGRVVLLTRNSIAEAIDTIATTAGRRVTVIEQDVDCETGYTDKASVDDPQWIQRTYNQMKANDGVAFT